MIKGHFDREYESYAYECEHHIDGENVVVECNNDPFPVPEQYDAGDIEGLLDAGYLESPSRTYSILSRFSFVSQLKPPVDEKKRGLLQDEIEEMMEELATS